MQQPALNRKDTRRIPDGSLLASVAEAYERGQTVEALRQAESFAPLPEWSGVRPCVLAARIATNTGSPRLATKLRVRAWKVDPCDAEALPGRCALATCLPGITHLEAHARAQRLILKIHHTTNQAAFVVATGGHP